MMKTKLRPCVCRIFYSLLLCLMLLAVSAHARASQSAPDPKLEKAIATLRHIDQSKIPKEQQAAKSKEIDDAWDVIRAAGPTGVARLKEEVRRVEQNKEEDNFFKLNASRLLWNISKLDEAETIARIWQTTPLKAQYNYVFYTAMEAATTQDARALPMLKAVIRDDEGGVYFSRHSMDVRWPVTHEFIWGAYGAKGLPVLAGMLETSTFSVELKSLIELLTRAYHYESLPKIRALTKSPISDVRRAAIRSLGFFGHPQDYEFLISGLRLTNEEEVFHYVYALYEYEDLRAIQHLIPLTKSEDEFFRREVLAALLQLVSLASFDALYEFCRDQKGEQQRSECNGLIAIKLEEYKLEWEGYARMSAAEKEKFFKELRRSKEEEYQLKSGDKTLTRQQLAEAVKEWRANSRAFTEQGMEISKAPGADPNKFVAKMYQYGWVKERHVLSVATLQDRDMLLDARAALYTRLSDEGLGEAKRIEAILQRIVRRHYRKEPGLTAKAEAK